MLNKKIISVRSIYGKRTHQPLVEIIISPGTSETENGNQVIRIVPKEAKALALNILQASESSIVDAFLIDFMRKNDILDEPQTQKLVVAFRNYRSQQEYDIQYQ